MKKNSKNLDGHFTICFQIVTLFRKSPDRTFGQIVFNSILAFVRARVEHINGYIVRHGMFKGIYRGSIEKLRDCIKITVHTSAVVLRTKVRYHPIGPHNHF